MEHQLDAGALRAGLPARRIGREIIVLQEVDSTNGYVLDHLAGERGEASDGSVVFAEYQTAGRGRLGRSWHCPRGAGLTFSTLLWEGPGGAPAARMIMSAALAVARGIGSATEIDPEIRWPNDLYVRGRKVAGILVEVRACGDRPMPVAIGIGVNCLQQAGHFPAELRDIATSLEIESRHPVDRGRVAQAIMRELDGLFAKPPSMGDAALAAAWRERVADLGERVTLVCNGERHCGQVVDVNPQTGLLLLLDSGARREFDLATVSRE